MPFQVCGTTRLLPRDSQQNQQSARQKVDDQDATKQGRPWFSQDRTVDCERGRCLCVGVCGNRGCDHRFDDSELLLRFWTLTGNKRAQHSGPGSLLCEGGNGPRSKTEKGRRDRAVATMRPGDPGMKTTVRVEGILRRGQTCRQTGEARATCSHQAQITGKKERTDSAAALQRQESL